jgi:hypothetical protein
LSWHPAVNALGYNVSQELAIRSTWLLWEEVALWEPLSNTSTVKTNLLPGGKIVANWKSMPGEGSTIIKADILVPYAFIPLYICDSAGCDFDENPEWSVSFKVDKYVCTHYMV